MKLKKIIIYLTIFTLVFHFSIPQALASEVDGSEVGIDSDAAEEEHVDEPGNENTDDEAQKYIINEAESKFSEELPYTLEDSHDRIIIIKEKLNALGFDEPKETKVFDEFMAKQVKEFQHYYELEITGEVDELTLEKLNEVYHSQLQKGNEHTETVMIKKMLSTLGYDEFEEGQVFGELTEANVKAFQDDNDLLVNGIVDAPTLALLEEAFALEMSLEDDSEEQAEEATGEETTESTEVEEAPAETTSEESITEEEETKNRSLQRSSVSPMSAGPPYENGDNHPEISDMKVMLNALGFDGLTTNGVFGNWTETRVSEFQEYYDLSSPRGIADQETLNKVSEVYNSPYQNGNSNEQSSEIKVMLSALGYSGLNSGPVFGNLTERRLKEFQRDHDLMDHGIGDEITVSKLEELYKVHEFRNGDNHPDISDMKVMLNALGFDGLTTNGVFGNWTETRVSQFQEYYDLSSPRGIADQETLNKVSEVYNSPYQNGNSNEQSSEIKVMLSALGYSGLNSGPVFGNLTERRLKEFQRDHDLMDHGIGDEITVSKLEELYNADEFRNGDNHPDISDMKVMLNALGFDGLTTNGVFGNWTENRVSQFQEYYDLSSPRGVADQETLNKVSEVYNSPYQKGNSNEQTSEIKVMLSALGYSGLNSGPVFGALTETLLKEFQRDHGLMAHGIGDEITISKLEELYNADEFRNGNTHPEIATMKRMLNALGFDGLTTNGVFGNWTETRVAEFQEYYELSSPRGVADQKTLNKVSEVYNSPYQKGNSNEQSSVIKIMLSELGYSGLNNGPVFGTLTERRLKEFQRDYGLVDHGIADEPTIAKLEKVHDEFVFKNGDTSPEIAEMKRKLNRLGFDGLSTNGVFGNWTETRVSDFQAYYGLRITGVADYTTQQKIDEVYNSPYQNGNSDPYISEIKQMLSILQYSGLNSGPVFGNLTERRVKEFQENHGLVVNGIVDEVTLETMLLAIDGIRYTRYDLTLSEALAIQMAANPQTDNNYAYVSKTYIDGNDSVTANLLNVRPTPGTSRGPIGQLEEGEKVTILEDVGGWYRIEYTSSAWKNASQEDTLKYLDPRNFLDDEKQVFQFLDLSRPSNASATVLNNYLVGRGILEGHGQAFIDASNQNGVSDIYLLSHALLETGHGTSDLATGVEVNGETVYNMYGIGANDHCALECGSQRAYEEGWFTPYDAIVGGAEFIGEDYIQAGQSTLYQMRWNPAAMENLGYAHHQYATDIGWASKQISNMYDMYQEIGMRNLVLNIPFFKYY